MDLATLRKELASKKIRTAYLFSGDQDLLKEEALEALRAAAGGARGVVRKLHAGDIGAVEILEAQSNFSLLEPIVAIVVRQAAKLGDAQCEILANGLARISGGPSLVFWDTSLDKRRKLFAEIVKQGAEVEFPAPRRRDLQAWVEAEAGRLRHRLGPGVADLLADLVGADLLTLRSTLEVLSLAVGPGNPIDEDAVTRMVPAARAHAVWELQEALVSRDAGRALRLLRQMLDEGETTFMMVGALAAELRRLLLAHEMDPRTGPAQAAPLLGVPPFRVEKLLAQARRFSGARLRAALERLRAIDLGLKTGQGEAEGALEDWILRLCASEERAAAAAAPLRRG